MQQVEQKYGNVSRLPSQQVAVVEDVAITTFGGDVVQ